MINSLPSHIAYRYFLSSKFNRFARLIQILSILGITIGVAILIVISSIFNGFQHEIKESLKSVSPHIIISHEDFWWQDWQKTVSELEKESNVENIEAKIRTYAMIASRNNNQPIQLIADQELKKTTKSLVKGTKKSRNLSPLEILDADISIDLKNELWLEPGDTFGIMTAKSLSVDENEVMALRLKVKSIGQKKHNIFSQRSVKTDINKLTEQLKIPKNSITELQIDIENIMNVQKTVDHLKTKLSPSLKISNVSEQYTSLLGALAMQKKMMIIVLSLVIIIATFNLTASLVMIVMERKGEIAILQTIGMTRGNILSIFVYQSLLLSGIGLLFGCLFGITLAMNITDVISTLEKTLGIDIVSDQVFMLDHLPSIVLGRDIAAIAMVTLILTIISALYPAYMASKVDPAETLRYE